MSQEIYKALLAPIEAHTGDHTLTSALVVGDEGAHFLEINRKLTGGTGGDKRTFVHAEVAAILGLIRECRELPVEIHLLWFPCHECAKVIVEAGIQKVYLYDHPTESVEDSRWAESFALTHQIFKDNGVETYVYVPR